MKSQGEEVTRLLQEWRGGRQDALERLMPLVYEELHLIASRHMAREWRAGALQTTALVSEAYLKLVGQRDVDWQNRAHFFAMSAKMMRRVLVDVARSKSYLKRGGGAAREPLEHALNVTDERPPDLVALDTALEALARIDERKSRVVELRFFGGFSVEETAAALDVSQETVHRDWRLAKSWLRRELRGRATDES